MILLKVARILLKVSQNSTESHTGLKVAQDSTESDTGFY
jgi:hypothetical protein